MGKLCKFSKYDQNSGSYYRQSDIAITIFSALREIYTYCTTNIVRPVTMPRLILIPIYNLLTKSSKWWFANSNITLCTLQQTDTQTPFSTMELQHFYPDSCPIVMWLKIHISTQVDMAHKRHTLQFFFILDLLYLVCFISNNDIIYSLKVKVN